MSKPLLFSGPPFTWHPPSAALIYRFTVSPLLYSANSEAPGTIYDFQPVHDARACLTLVGPGPIAYTTEWSQLEEQELHRLLGVPGVFQRGIEIQPPHIAKTREIDPEDARAVVAGFFQLHGEHRGKLALAIGRFDRALRRHDPGDAAVELSVALEALLGDGEGELIWKVGLRAAILAGGPKAEMLKRRAIVEAIYKLRSKVVHSGAAPAEQKIRGRSRLATQELVTQGISVAADVIRAAIKRHAMPDWFEAELGSAPASVATAQIQG